MAAEWRDALLGDVVELKRGYDLPHHQRVSGTVPVVSSSGPSGFHTEAMARAPGVVTGRYGTLGEVFYITEDFWPLNTTLYVRDFKGNAPQFISYLLRTVDFLSCSDKGAVPGVNRNHLHALKVRVPPLDHQRAIAHILGALDKKIELNRRTNEILEDMAQAVFKSWFVDFDPVQAKLGRRKPSGMDTETAALFPSEFENSERGPIPKGWKVVPISELATIVGGNTPSTKEPAFWEDGVHCWATPKDLSALKTPVLLNTERKITDAGLSQISSGLLPPGTVLLSSRAPIGYLAISEVPVAINQGFIGMLPREGVPGLFLLRWAEWAHDEIVSRANGSTFLEISKGSFRPIPVVAPGRAVLEAFAGVAGSLHQRLVANERESETLARTRDALLPQLLSGDVDLGDPARFLTEAV